MLWCVRGWMCEWKRRLHCEKRGIIKFSSSAVEMANERILQPSSPCWLQMLMPEYLHFPSISSCPPPPPDSRDLQRLGGNIERASLLLTTTTIRAKVARASRGLSSVITTLRHGVLISPIRPTEGNRLFQCALTETNRRLPASMASNTHRRVFRKRARQSSPPYTVLPGQEPILPWRPSRPASLLQRWPSQRRPFSR